MKQFLKSTQTKYALLLAGIFLVNILMSSCCIAQNIQTMGNKNNTVEVLGKFIVDSSMRCLALKNTNGDTYILTTDNQGKFKLIPAPTGGGGMDYDTLGYYATIDTLSDVYNELVNFVSDGFWQLQTILVRVGDSAYYGPEGYHLSTYTGGRNFRYPTVRFTDSFYARKTWVTQGLNDLNDVLFGAINLSIQTAVLLSDTIGTGLTPNRPWQFASVYYLDRHYAKHDGNTLPGALMIGTNNYQPFYIETNNTPVISVSEVGKVKIGDLFGAGPTPTCAELEVSSKTGGFLPPRMTLTERNTIPNPQPGLIIFCTTDDNLHVYKSAGWKVIQTL